MSGFVLDTGALIALERADRRVMHILLRTQRDGGRLALPAGVLAQAWRASPRQARLAHLVGSPHVDVVPLDEQVALAAGTVLAESGGVDAVDASVVVCARQRGQPVMTSDVRDFRRLARDVNLLAV